MYEIDEAMLGDTFNAPHSQFKNAYLRFVASYLTEHEVETVAILDTFNGAKLHHLDEIPSDALWSEALRYADDQFEESFWDV